MPTDIFHSLQQNHRVFLETIEHAPNCSNDLFQEKNKCLRVCSHNLVEGAEVQSLFPIGANGGHKAFIQLPWCSRYSVQAQLRSGAHGTCTSPAPQVLCFATVLTDWLQLSMLNNDFTYPISTKGSFNPGWGREAVGGRYPQPTYMTLK